MTPRTDDVVIPARASGLGSLTLRLTRARFAGRQGETMLYGAAVLAATACAAVAFTLAGGTWMFYRRATAPTGLLAELMVDPTFAMILRFYVGLAALACALVLPALLSLVAAGVQLGARGRERRLAALRLIGLSSRDVTAMALMDAVIQTTSGTTIGAAIYLVTLPLWGRLSFQAVPITPVEMLLPPWLLVALACALVVLGLLASAWGLRQVRISPLGVARRTNRPALRVWRLGLLAFVVVASTMIVPRSLGSQGALYVFAGVIVVMLLAADIAGPWLLQQAAKPLARVPWPAVMTAARRVVANPLATWRRVSTLGVLAFAGGYIAAVPFSYDPKVASSSAEHTFMSMAREDFVYGAAITLMVGFLLTAISLLITQASTTLERAEQSRALAFLGASRSFDLGVMWFETFGPLMVSTLLGAGLGVWVASPMARLVRRAGLDQGSNAAPVLVVLTAGLAIAALAIFASHPLHRRVVGSVSRRAD